MAAAAPRVYDVWTDASREDIEAVALEIFKDWLAFAEGKAAIGGRLLMHPTGRYASSLRMDMDDHHVAIIADEEVAPEAAFLEVGHGSYDLKQQLHGAEYKHIKMRRGGGEYARVVPNAVAAAPRTGPRFMRGFGPALYASRRARYGTGMTGKKWATMSENSDPDSWILPPMPAYQPGWLLAERARERLRESRG